MNEKHMNYKQVEKACDAICGAMDREDDDSRAIISKEDILNIRIDTALIEDSKELLENPRYFSKEYIHPLSDDVTRAYIKSINKL